jgi:hypothetical protein
MCTRDEVALDEVDDVQVLALLLEQLLMRLRKVDLLDCEPFAVRQRLANVLQF